MSLTTIPRCALEYFLLRATAPDQDPYFRPLTLMPRERFNESLAEGDVHLVPQDPEAADFAVPSKDIQYLDRWPTLCGDGKRGQYLVEARQKNRRVLLCSAG